MYLKYSTKYYSFTSTWIIQILAVFFRSWAKFMESISKLKMLRTFIFPRRFDLLDLCRIYDSNVAAMTQKLLLENVGYSWLFEKYFLKSTPKSELYLFAIFKIWLAGTEHEPELSCIDMSWAEPRDDLLGLMAPELL